ncbi:hypothetical protein I316_03555 [Kwoniella heveanensis BCC8398]|uniref:Carrier domain-containing protein n=1 Tax=Kwoniella heveanensis BCC8398 TaxID=1296120 RepID=A0A1B9GTX1_9TREE|nr:hypothetical protein I316_03555 [Kwoniella heveanensis BCC8398]
MSISYLVSTAGHAQHQNECHPHHITSILQLIQEGSQELGDEKVVGFTSLSEGGSDGAWTCLRLSFRELLALSGKLVPQLNKDGLEPPTDGKNVVSLLCPTGLDFLLAWIGLMRMGYGVVFIAPQCSPSAVDHLVHTTSSSYLLYHPKYAELAQSAGKLSSRTTSSLALPTYDSYRGSGSTPSAPGCSVVDSTAISHVFHTSGTSGTPKPIPYTHIGSVAPLPRRRIPSYLSRSSGTGEASMLPSESAAFTTTPLFHGGVSDLLRAWMARSMIYFYPTSDTPITAANVVNAVRACDGDVPQLSGMPATTEGSVERQKRFKVTSFLSVPYILTILAEDIDGPAIKLLKDMEFVSTGGAPLDRRIGDLLVNNGVRLVSRLGSSECGFLLSSHRQYETEKDWEWLRNDSPYASAIKFEPVEGEQNKFEMVVTDKWASKTKSNREDGSYASGDLYEPHPTKQHVWRYAGRGDDQSNGEKASPGPFETALRASQFLSDSLVVGSDRPQLGLLLFPRSSLSEITGTQLLDEMKPLLEEANKSSPSFAQISVDMCSIVTDKTKALPKSSKGTVQRGVAYDVFKAEIEKLYEASAGGNEQTLIEERSKEEIARHIQAVISDVAASRLKVDGLKEDTDLFSWGLDSLMATRVRSSMQKVCPSLYRRRREDDSSYFPTRLAQYVYDLQEENVPVINDENSHGLMIDLLRRYGKFEGKPPPSQSSETMRERDAKTLLLTGGTGSLGAFLIDQWLNDSTSQAKIADRRVICLVRATDDVEARQRVLDSLQQRGISPDYSRVECYAADLVEADLGLSAETYQDISERVDAIIHAAWPVHFASSLVSFESNIKGTRNLLDLLSTAKNTQSMFHYCSSLASVLGDPSSNILEEATHDPSSATSIGYSQSKWVTENVCEAASTSERLRGRVHVLRVGQLCGDTKSGHWNEKEGWPLMFRTACTTGTLPKLQERPSFLPVDIAAKAIVDVVEGAKSKSPLVYHIVHPDPIDWSAILDGLTQAGLQFEAVLPRTWLEKVAESLVENEEDPSGQMLNMWRSAYGDDSKVYRHVDVGVTHAKAISSTLRDIKPVDREQLRKMVAAWRKTGFL